MSNFITLTQAVVLTTNFRNQKENLLAPAYKGKDVLPNSETFDRASFQALLDETDCTFIRIYLGMDSDQKIRLVAVGADSKNNDILPWGGASPAASLGEGGNIVEDGIRCPPSCNPPSPLNPE